MREEIYYVSADYPEWLFSTYTGSKRKKAIEDLQKTIRILKFYSNNDFAFKDVHNEELFYQNGKILVEMVQLFEKYRIVYPSKHQFLGDLFEQLLNKGFKQNEGQFFTPMPITRFIWDSLPVDRMVKTERGTVYPKVVDYACGAGHFLTEAVEAIDYFSHAYGDNSWTRDHIFGIEKDYRLARVAKISLFMNGAGEGNIIFGDGLENASDKGIDNGAFDILVANPPYSVKDFKQHLQLKNNSFTLLDRIGLNGGEIETLFVERIGQLLKPRGIAAVILPSSILSNDSASYTGAREQFLQNFYIRAIVAFGSKTFGATGTNTVVMFLEKFNEPPKRIDLSADSVDAIFNGTELKDWKDKEILDAYIAQIEVDEGQYNSFLHKDFSLDELGDIDYFKMYVVAFADSTDAKTLQKTRAYKNKSADEQKTLYLEKVYAYAHEVEREKLFYFSLVYRQTTVIITAPADNKEQKDFLGYDWSNRKGNEGIQIIKHGGKLYDNADREAKGTLAHAIRQSFRGVIPSFSEEQKAWGFVASTKDMLDFSRVGFNKAMRLSARSKFHIHSKYPMKLLSSVCKMNISKTEVKDMADDTLISFVEMSSVSNDGFIEKKIDRHLNEVRNGGYTYFSDGDIIIAKITPCMENGKCAIATGLTNGIGFGSSEFHTFRCHSDEIITRYLFLLLNQNSVRQAAEAAMTGASGHRRVPASFYEEMMIPVPPISVQQQIVDECSKIDAEYETTRMSIEAYRQKIEDLFRELDVISSGGYRLSDIFEWVTAKISASTITSATYVTTDTMLQRCGGIREYTEPMPDANVTAFEKGDILLSNIRPYLQKLWFATFSGGCSNDVLVLRAKDPQQTNPAFYASYLKRQVFFDYIMQDVNGAKMPRGKKPHITNYRVPSIDIGQQNEIVAKVESIETQIREAERKLEALTGKTAEILNHYLN